MPSVHCAGAQAGALCGKGLASQASGSVSGQHLWRTVPRLLTQAMSPGIREVGCVYSAFLPWDWEEEALTHENPHTHGLSEAEGP